MSLSHTFSLWRALSNFSRSMILLSLILYSSYPSLICTLLQYILARYPSVEALVRTHYPSHEWHSEKFVQHTGLKPTFAPQTFLERVVRTIFPNYEILSNLRSVHGIVSTSGTPLEIDVYLPELKVGFEYQVSKENGEWEGWWRLTITKDQHHYFNVSYGTSTLSEYLK